MDNISSSTGISVVIPTYNRSGYVTALLDSLTQARRRFGESSEVIVVDSSLGEEAGSIKSACQQHDARYFLESQSVRAKRNKGVQESRYPIILFVDSDVIVHPDILTEHMKIHQVSDVHLGGVYGLTRFTGSRSTLWQIIERTPLVDVFSFAEKYPRVQWAIGNNISYRRDVFKEVGGFDTSFPFRLGGDDLDLGLRITKAGYYIKTNPCAITFHTRETWNSLRAVLERSWRWGRMEYHIFQKHPFLRSFDLPKRSVIMFVVSLIAVIQSLIEQNPYFLLLPLVWLACTLIFETAFTIHRQKAPWLSFGYEIAARVLRFFYQMSTLFEFIRHVRLKVFYKRNIFSPEQIQNEWEGEVITAWSHLFALLILLIIGLMFHTML